MKSLIKGLTIEEAVEKFKWPKNNPIQCEINLTYRCNIRCIHCYNKDRSTEINRYEAYKIIFDNYKRGARFLTITGGEPTLYSDLADVIYFAKKIGYKFILLNTNGILLSDYNLAKKLYESGLNIVKISIHSYKEHVHNNIVGCLAYDRVIKAIENSIRVGFYVEANSVVTALNYKDLPGLTDFLTKEFGISTCMTFVHLYGNAKINRSKIALSYSEHIKYLKEALSIILNRKIKPSCHLLGNYVPCVLPGYEHLMMDWEDKLNNIKEDIFTSPSFEEKIIDICKKNRMKSKNCMNCIYYQRCIGFEIEYFNNVGEKEFTPIISPPKPFKLKSFYYTSTPASQQK